MTSTGTESSAHWTLPHSLDLLVAGEVQREADINQDGAVTLLDVEPFVAVSSGECCRPVGQTNSLEAITCIYLSNFAETETVAGADR